MPAFRQLPGRFASRQSTADDDNGFESFKLPQRYILAQND